MHLHAKGPKTAFKLIEKDQMLMAGPCAKEHALYTALYSLSAPFATAGLQQSCTEPIFRQGPFAIDGIWLYSSIFYKICMI